MRPGPTPSAPPHRSRADWLSSVDDWCKCEPGLSKSSLSCHVLLQQSPVTLVSAGVLPERERHTALQPQLQTPYSLPETVSLYRE